MADLLNKYHVGVDGRTAYSRIRGREYKGEMNEFGKRVYHMSPGKPQGGNMKERWNEGVFLGKRKVSDESLVMNTDGTIVKTRSVRLLPECES